MSRMTASPLFGGSETPSLLDLHVLPQGHPQHELLGHGESLAVRGHHQGRVCG